jgi:hypothetical protein
MMSMFVAIAFSCILFAAYWTILMMNHGGGYAGCGRS